MRNGAYDYLTKPLDLERLKVLIPRAIEKYQVRTANRDLQQRLESLTRFGDMLIRRRPMPNSGSRHPKPIPKAPIRLDRSPLSARFASGFRGAYMPHSQVASATKMQIHPYTSTSILTG